VGKGAECNTVCYFSDILLDGSDRIIQREEGQSLLKN
jgi:hypothetical protein